jgi:hypothetical protein
MIVNGFEMRFDVHPADMSVVERAVAARNMPMDEFCRLAIYRYAVHTLEDLQNEIIRYSPSLV